MWPFNRRKTDAKEVPPEVQQYYDSEHRERVGLAWLVAFLSLVLTIVIIAGLFFGGRWIYRKVANRNKPTTVGQGPSGQSVQSPNSNLSQPSKPNDLQPAAPSQNQSTNPQNSQSQSQTQTQTQPSQTGTSSTSTTTPGGPSTTSGKSSQNITNTGPGDTVAIFLGVTILAGSAHWAYQRRKINSF